MCGVPQRGWTRAKAVGSSRSTPAAKGRREIAVPRPPNCPTAAGHHQHRDQRREPRRSRALRAASSPASARPFISLISPGRRITSSATVAEA